MDRSQKSRGGSRKGKSKVVDDNGEYHFSFKVSILGDAGVGKSTLLHAQVSGQATASAETDDALKGPGIRFKSQEFKQADKLHRVIFWDCPGAEPYLKLTTQLCAGSAAVMLVFDVNSKITLDHIDDWIAAVTAQNQNPIMLLVGNKIDQPSSHRQVMPQQANAIAAKHGMDYVETSASENKLENAFTMLYNKVIASIPSPAEASQLFQKNIKIGRLLGDDADYRTELFASYEINSDSNEDLTEKPDWASSSF